MSPPATMPDAVPCTRCGGELPPAYDPARPCPRCLLAAGLGTDPGEVFATGGASPAPAPEVSELAPLFPQLAIEGLLGQGGMGFVYRARQRQLERDVALKVLRPGAGDPAFAERFLREARALARLQHPGIVTVHDFGCSGGRFWLLMELVDGTNLRQVLRSRALTPGQALEIVKEVCDALQYAHGQGVVHRDIKPENILLDRAGRVKIADFGLAKLARPAGAADPGTLTETRQAMGTPLYMAPEQIESPRLVDHRADIYSLGVVLYELLTGELPLGRFAPPSQKVAVDVRLDEVVLRTLEKEPDRRYQHASEVRTGIEQAGTPVRAGEASWAEPERKERTSSVARTVTIVLAVLVFLMFALGGCAALFLAARTRSSVEPHSVGAPAAPTPSEPSLSRPSSPSLDAEPAPEPPPAPASGG